MKRRFFLFAAPAIVSAPSLMKVSALVMPSSTMFPSLITSSLIFREAMIGLENHLIIDIERARAELIEVTGTPNLLRGAQSA